MLAVKGFAEFKMEVKGLTPKKRGGGGCQGSDSSFTAAVNHASRILGGRGRVVKWPRR